MIPKGGPLGLILVTLLRPCATFCAYHNFRLYLESKRGGVDEFCMCIIVWSGRCSVVFTSRRGTGTDPTFSTLYSRSVLVAIRLS
jgi:hypothetical protein